MNITLYAVSCLVVVLFVAICPAADKLDPKQVAGWLEQPILEPETSLKEAQAYCRARVRPWAEFESVAAWEAAREQMCGEVLKHVVFRGEAANWRDAKLGVEYLDTIDGGPGYSIRKLRYEALPGLWIPALLYVPEKLAGKVPVALHVNGHDRAGKAADYKQLRSIHLAQQGVIVLNAEWLGMGQLHLPNFGHYKMNQLDLCGTSGLAPFYLAMSRGLDVLLSQPHADPERVAVAGLSGGGWQTILISSLDERVTLANPVAGYSSFLTRIGVSADLGDSEQTPVDLAKYADYFHLTALRAPRPTLLTYNAKDNCCFVAKSALPPLLEVAAPLYKLYGKPESLQSHVNEEPGDHNFGLDNRLAYYRFVGEHFFANQPFSAEEDPALAQEVKTADELNVPLLEGNADFNTLALKLAESLPRTSEPPRPGSGFAVWKKEFVRRLNAEILRWPTDRVTYGTPGDDKQVVDDIHIVRERIRLGGHWTVPVIHFRPVGARRNAAPTALTILSADAGRSSLSERVAAILDEGQEAVVVDPLYFGECGLGKQDYLYGLLLSSVGDRLLGIQAAQIDAAIRWAGEQQIETFRLETFGPRSSLIGLLAATQSDVIDELITHDAMKSLKNVLTQNKGVNDAPELFTFGLLEFADIPHLMAAFGRPVTAK